MSAVQVLPLGWSLMILHTDVWTVVVTVVSTHRCMTAINAYLTIKSQVPTMRKFCLLPPAFNPPHPPSTIEPHTVDEPQPKKKKTQKQLKVQFFDLLSFAVATHYSTPLSLTGCTTQVPGWCGCSTLNHLSHGHGCRKETEG
ncbi:hypothetical protein CPC08DRAFT_53713 [Agrocybe pediades]|nr:hypothetical protein CPC08DRAFT_53713 [Agrocybe pediades]